MAGEDVDDGEGRLLVCLVDALENALVGEYHSHHLVDGRYFEREHLQSEVDEFGEALALAGKVVGLRQVDRLQQQLALLVLAHLV